MRRPLTGEPLPLDLVNTVGPFGDALADLAGVRAWLVERGLGDCEPTDGLRSSLLVARAALRELLEHPADPQAIAAVNAVLAHGRIRPVLTGDGPGELVEVDDAERALAFAAARELLGLLSTDAGRLKRCGGDGCVLWFLDATRSGTRRWCSMAGCGNRTKVRRHRARARGPASPGGPA